MNEVFLLWGFGLFALALVLFVVELFLPTGGVIGALVGVAAISGVVAFFRASTTWGVFSLLFLVVVSPIAFAFALKVWPNTPVGRRLILGSADEPGDEAPPEPSDADALRAALIGAIGTAVTDLRPVGMVQIEGERIEAHAEGGMIESGRPVRITAVLDNRVRVREIV